jgi:hypothetical protein
VKDSLDRAETWVGRFHVVGLQQSASEVSDDLDSPVFEAQGKEEGGYETPSPTSSNSVRSISHSIPLLRRNGASLARLENQLTL